jgi:hypothetical protein
MTNSGERRCGQRELNVQRQELRPRKTGTVDGLEVGWSRSHGKRGSAKATARPGLEKERKGSGFGLLLG